MLDLRAALTGTLRRMHYVRRYSSIPTILPENVAEHSWQVAMLGYLIAEDINWRGDQLVNTGEVTNRAIMHDVSEAMSGDIIRSFKHGSEAIRVACKEMDKTNVEYLCIELGASETFVMEFLGAKDQTLEGQIVSLSDMLCVVSYCISEHRLGNRQADFVLEELYHKELTAWALHPVLGYYITAIFPNENWRDAYEEAA